MDFIRSMQNALSRVNWKKVGTAAMIAGAIATAIAGVASANSQSQQIDEAVSREINKRLPPIVG